MNFCESFTHRKKRPSAGDAGASSDLAFLLIIYFIVIAGFNINKGFILHLPAKDSMRHVKSDALLRFELDDTGSILFRGNPLAQPAVEDLIRQGKSANPQLAVALVISTWTPW
ncbi:MAG: biopolymer transporter ExbD, partial [Spirochaetaceae bacterium]|nr:biopolymer transporter ExbD [Spirochaetaceae bacterium]